MNTLFKSQKMDLVLPTDPLYQWSCFTGQWVSETTSRLPVMDCVLSTTRNSPKHLQILKPKLYLITYQYISTDRLKRFVSETCLKHLGYGLGKLTEKVRAISYIIS